jgi:retinol dehydrogenase 12
MRVVLTGANRGIGRATALALAEKEADLVLLGRDRAGLVSAARAVDTIAGRPAADVVAVDLASLDSVRRAAVEIRRRYGSVSVLINNAAIIPRTRLMSQDGYELQFAVNHLAPFLLTNLLLEALHEDAPARIVNVSSHAHYRSRLGFDDLQCERGYKAGAVYARTKLANVLFTRELARRLDPTEVTANALHPGVVATGLLADLVGLPTWMGWLFRPLVSGATTGARTSVFLATSPDVDGVTGQYFAKCRPKTPSRTARDDELARHLWDLSASLVGLGATP